MENLASRLEGVRLLAFDLDNTLYDEGTYFAAALDRIAPRVAVLSGGDATVIRSRFEEILAAQGKHYHHLFNDVLAEQGLAVEDHLAGLLAEFAAVSARLDLFPGVAELLVDLRATCKVGLITSGREAVQANKIRLLGLQGLFDHVIFSSTLSENKPGQMPFRMLCETLAVEPTAAVYVGDNPLFDFKGSGEIGMTTIRVPNPEFDDHVCAPGWDAQFRLAHVTELRGFLPKMEKAVARS